MPTRTISLKQFKSLLHRRSMALSPLRSSSTTSKRNPNAIDNGILVPPKLEFVDNTNREEGEGTSKCSVFNDVKDDRRELYSGECSGELPVVAEKGCQDVDGNGNLRPEKLDSSADPDPVPEVCKDDVMNDKGRRKKEVEEKLLVLNAKKHNLVQVLKQILSVEEELKRRNSMQGMASCPSAALQVDITNDSGSMSRHATPRMGSEGNLGGDVEGGETEDVSNPNNHSRHIHRMSITSPSSESPLRKPPCIQHDVVMHPSQPGLGVTSSPSRLAPTGNQGPPANVPMVSGSGTNYIASSPSPAASGGTSAFRDARQPGPGN